jgi:hypothetical protein
MTGVMRMGVLAYILAAAGAGGAAVALVGQKPLPKASEGEDGVVVGQRIEKRSDGAHAQGPEAKNTPDQSSQVIALSALVVSTAQSHIAAVQTVAVILAALLGLAAVVNLRVAFRYGSALDAIARQASKCDSDLRGLREQIGRDTSRLAAIDEQTRKMDEEVRSLISKKSELEEGFATLTVGAKRLMTDVAVLDKVIVFRTGSPAARVSALKYLSQAVHPTAVYVMSEALAASSNDDVLRREAAYGLGRFSENLDLRPLWSEIIECFLAVLGATATPVAVALAAVEGAKRFEPLAQVMPEDTRTAFGKARALFQRWESPIIPEVDPCRGNGSLDKAQNPAESPR